MHFLIVSHTCTFVIDRTEQKSEEPSELVQAEETNPEQEKDKPRCINHYPWTLFLFMF
jgi:hypothetical protein